MTLAIADGHTVTMHYRLTLDDGVVADDSFAGDAFVYQHGKGTLVPGLERSLAGKKAGDECEVEVAPALGYGEYDPTAEQSVPRTEFPAGMELRVGAELTAQGPHGLMTVWVRKLEAEHVVLTTNHPLAGQRLTYKVRVIDVREATAAEQGKPDSG